MLLTLMIAAHCELIILSIGLSRISKYRLIIENFILKSYPNEQYLRILESGENSDWD